MSKDKCHVFIEDVKDHQDGGRWRSYDLEAEGSTLDELLSSAVYWQTDQDGGSMGEIEADDDTAVQIITEKFNEWVAAQEDSTLDELLSSAFMTYADKRRKHRKPRLPVEVTDEQRKAILEPDMSSYAMEMYQALEAIAAGSAANSIGVARVILAKIKGNKSIATVLRNLANAQAETVVSKPELEVTRE